MTFGGSLLCAESCLKANWLDGARLLLAIIVIFSHSFDLTLGSNISEPLMWLSRGQLSLGGLAVDGFFVISGFLIVRSWENAQSVWDFVWKRILRIYPGFLLAVIFAVSLAAACGPDGRAYLHQLSLYPAKHFMVGLAKLSYDTFDVEGFTFVHNPYTNLNGSLWSLKYEILAYAGVVVFGLLNGFRRKPVMMILAVLLLGGNAASLLGTGASFKWLRLETFFAVGGAFYLFRAHVPRSRVLWIAGIVILVACLRIPPLFNAVLPLVLPYLLFYVTLREPAPWYKKIMVGDLSYGAYVLAWPVQQVVVQWIHPSWPMMTFCIATPVILLCAAASWHWVEKPALKLKNWTFRAEPAIASTEVRP